MWCAGQSFRMDVDTTKKIEGLLADLNKGALKSFRRQALTVHASDQPNAFEDRSSAITWPMAYRMARLAEENAMKLMADATSKVASISTAPDAFVLIDAAVMAHIMMLESEVEKGWGVLLNGTLLQFFGEKFEAVRQRSIRSLELRRSSFTNLKTKVVALRLTIGKELLFTSRRWPIRQTDCRKVKAHKPRLRG